MKSSQWDFNKQKLLEQSYNNNSEFVLSYNSNVKFFQNILSKELFISMCLLCQSYVRIFCNISVSLCSLNFAVISIFKKLVTELSVRKVSPVIFTLFRIYFIVFIKKKRCWIFEFFIGSEVVNLNSIPDLDTSIKEVRNKCE